MVTCETCWRMQTKDNVKIYKGSYICKRCMMKEIRYNKGKHFSKHDYCGISSMEEKK